MIFDVPVISLPKAGSIIVTELAQSRREVLVSQRAAANAMKEATLDIGQRLELLTMRLDKATVEQRRALVDAIFPRRARYGLKLYTDGRIKALGALPMPSPEPPTSGSDGSSEGDDAEVKLKVARRSAGRFYLGPMVVEIRLEARVRRVGKGNYFRKRPQPDRGKLR